MKPRPPQTKARAFLLRIYVLVPALAAVGAITWAALSMVPPFRPVHVMRASMRRTPAPLPLRVALIDAGITADALSAAGVQSAQVAQVVSDGRDYAGNHGSDQSAAQEALAAAKSAVDTMERKVRSGVASEEEISSLTQLRATAASAQATLDTARGALFSAATASLSQGQRNLLTQISANRLVQIPIQYKVIDRAPADWTHLKRAVEARAITTRRGETLSETQQSLLTSADAQTDVATAVSNIAEHGPAVHTAWTAALAQ